jgi:hypothetical protein
MRTRSAWLHFVLIFGVLVSPAIGATTDNTPLRHYKSADWGFGIDIPQEWRGFPPNRMNSPNEIVRFYPPKPNTGELIVFRKPHDPKLADTQVIDTAEKILARGGYTHFVRGKAMLGAKSAITLDFDRAGPIETQNVREYFIFDDGGDYVLGFGTVDPAGMFPLYERMARSFTIKD